MKNIGLRDWLEPPEPRGLHWFQKRGRVFEEILNSMLSKEEMEARTSMRPSGEEIYGSFAIGDNFYLLEAKWHASPIPASALYSFKGKVDGKLIGTIGVFFSMSDYSTDAVDALLNGKELNLILFGHNDLLLIEDGKITFREAMRVKQRYAASYGQPFYPLETYFSETKLANLDIKTQIHRQKWIILVEGEDDVRTIQVLLGRFDIIAQFNVVPAGGQLAVAQLAEHLINNDKTNVAAIITPISDPDIQQEQIKRINEIGAELIVLKQDIELWLDNYVSVEYHNTAFFLSDRNGKMARRYARNADLEKLITENPSFSELMLKLGAKPKSTGSSSDF
ncbi:hypothetical protein QL995_07695 [Pseudoalteromonas sp. APC 3358]|uniref:hypothetical protein n=1 Tax=Pseudoalteromonas sp. APC 3358 TaxID=3035176 RepID=UPI0025B3DE7B|nr:hypothetical protein [Pseudoalteromonas sp. APC 3358]MDN3382551.1 hypothetical protein [Pseudoalteromonas sp. APC 3358]